MKEHFKLALNNIVHYGDTDIFPFPYETRMFADAIEQVADSLVETHNAFDDSLVEAPPVNVSTCSTVGYTGYRWATQIDPYWNSYFLGLVIALAEKIERSRLPPTIVYSYRYAPNAADSSLFDKDVSWRTFQEASLAFAVDSADVHYVVCCDIADFYPRIYHHRIENALDRLDPQKTLSSKIKKLIQAFSGTNSYGLPVGGPAARILAELALDSLDHMLSIKRISFKRYVDDFVIFCDTKEEAHSTLTFLSRKLMENEGLTLQKNKTTIMSREEFIALTEAKLRGFDDDEGSPMKARFLSLPIRYDPYSDNAVEQYEEIKRSLGDFDLLGMLSAELQKSKINQSFSKQLVRAFSVTEPATISSAFRIIFGNIAELYPIFTTVLQVAIANWDRLEAEAKEAVRTAIVQMVRSDSFILKTELNLAYLVRLLAKENIAESQELLVELYGAHPDSILISALITQAMGKWEVHYWLSDLKRTFPTMNAWQRRVFIVCSYLLGDEGDHWRTHNKAKFNFIEVLYRDWAAKRKSAQTLSEAL